MLSFIYRLFREFEQENGFRPNVLYINGFHLRCLRNELSDMLAGEDLNRVLGLEVMQRKDVLHPRVGWHQAGARLAS